ncbi:MAG: hypothetical protein AAF198_13365 [Pseudomonadota bacterium]
MIKLNAASIWKPSGNLILSPTSICFERFDRIGILAASGSGKTSLSKLLAGIDAPSTGSVELMFGPQTILGQENLLHPYMALDEALDIATKLLGLLHPNAVDSAMRFAHLTPPFPKKVIELSPIQKSNLAFALSIQRKSAWIIADDRLITNDPNRSALATAMIHSRLLNTGLVLITKNSSLISRFCSRFFALANAGLIPVRDTKIASAILRKEAA